MKKIVLTVAFLAACLAPVRAADIGTGSPPSLEERVKSLEERVAALEAKPPAPQAAAATLPPATPVAVTNAAGAVTTPAPAGMRWTKAGTIDIAAPWTLESAPAAVAPQFAAPTFPTPIRSFFAPSYGSCASGNCPQ